MKTFHVGSNRDVTEKKVLSKLSPLAVKKRLARVNNGSFFFLYSADFFNVELDVALVLP